MYLYLINFGEIVLSQTPAMSESQVFFLSWGFPMGSQLSGNQ